MIIMVESEDTDSHIRYLDAKFTIYDEGRYYKDMSWCREIASEHIAIVSKHLEPPDIISLHGVRKHSGSSYQKRARRVLLRNQDLTFTMNQLLQTFDILVTRTRSKETMTGADQAYIRGSWLNKSPIQGPHGLKMYMNNEKTPNRFTNHHLIYGTVENIPSGWACLPQVMSFLMLLPRVWATAQKNIYFWKAFGDRGECRRNAQGYLWSCMANALMLPLWPHQHARQHFWGFLYLLSREITINSRLLDTRPKQHWITGPAIWMDSLTIDRSPWVEATKEVIRNLSRHGPSHYIGIPILDY